MFGREKIEFLGMVGRSNDCEEKERWKLAHCTTVNILWTIWKGRNNFPFNGSRCHFVDAVHKAWREREEYDRLGWESTKRARNQEVWKGA